VDYGRFSNPHGGSARTSNQQAGMPWGEGYVIIPTFGWKQIGGDVSADKYGGTIARADGSSIELLKIQPVREYVGEGEARDVGYPFWTREASFDAADLDPNKKEVQSAMRSVGISKSDLADMTPEVRAVALAEAMLDYGHAEEGPAGWSKDLPNYDVEWSYGGKRQKMREYLAEEDDEFRREVLGEEDEDEE